MTRDIRGDDLAALRIHLLRQSVLFDSPSAYSAGVNDALDAVRHVLDSDEDDVLRLPEISVPGRMI